jgi:hypothetical protein
MATRITERASVIARGTIRGNGAQYRVYEDTQVGQRVQASYGTRWWLVLESPLLTDRPNNKLIQSTMKRSQYDEWMGLLRDNGIPA